MTPEELRRGGLQVGQRLSLASVIRPTNPDVELSKAGDASEQGAGLEHADRDQRVRVSRCEGRQLCHSVGEGLVEAEGLGEADGLIAGRPLRSNAPHTYIPARRCFSALDLLRIARGGLEASQHHVRLLAPPDK
jgi:hypothetical protein